MKPSIFSVGDRVIHTRRGVGHVIASDIGKVTVHFGDTSKGKPIIGIYDERWFEFARVRYTSLHKVAEAA